MRESIHGKVRVPENAKAIEYGRRAGYKTGGAVADGVHKHEKHLHKGEPETPLKKGGRVKRKKGGKVEGKKGESRLDKRPRKADGGGLAENPNAGAEGGQSIMPQLLANKSLGNKTRNLSMSRASGTPYNPHFSPFKKGGDVEKHKRARGGRAPKTNIIINTTGPGGGEGANPEAIQQAKQEGAKMGAMAVIQKIKGGAGGPPGMGGAPPGGPPPMGGPPPGMGGPPPGMPPMHAKGGKVKSGEETVKVKGHVRRKAGGKIGC